VDRDDTQPRHWGGQFPVAVPPALERIACHWVAASLKSGSRARLTSSTQSTRSARRETVLLPQRWAGHELFITALAAVRSVTWWLVPANAVGS
jgi:hypothetical protein